VLGALLAICEPNWTVAGRVIGTVGPILIGLAWAALVVWIVWGAETTRARWVVAAVFLFCLGANIAFYTAVGVQGDHDYLELFELSLLAATLLGLLVSAVDRGIGAVRLVSAALLGDIVVPGFLILWLFFALASHGSCLD
jgi:hypothetical protein